ncbi:hypothetical protein [Pontibacter indicus]|uniref:hypothetical protein n=1 Tax=Pontibacter indicus TaxID=1317125 RepID=UPI00147BFDA6|nr:hypothetical protein [Pontibacter indicus]
MIYFGKQRAIPGTVAFMGGYGYTCSLRTLLYLQPGNSVLYLRHEDFYTCFLASAIPMH